MRLLRLRTKAESETSMLVTTARRKTRVLGWAVAFKRSADGRQLNYRSRSIHRDRAFSPKNSDRISESTICLLLKKAG